MITPAEIKARAFKYWHNQRALRACLTGEAFFPLTVPFRKPASGQLLNDFPAVRQWLQTLRQGSKAERGYGYTLRFKPVRHRQLGEQALPQRISFDTADDLFRFIGKQKEFARLLALVKQIESAQPALRPWVEAAPLKVLEYDNRWPHLLRTLEFFQRFPKPNRYLRELNIPGVDSKFIEQHKRILRELLDHVLPAQAIHSEFTTVAGHGFEKRYGLKYDEPLIRFRLLDTRLSDTWGVCDLSVPLSQFARLHMVCQRVFITENKMNGLAFPAMAGSIVIFGLGYGINSLKEVHWLRDKALYYWGDIDTHGFAILSQLREHLPATKSFLMDQQTLQTFRSVWAEELEHQRYTGVLANLTHFEREVYELLRTDALGSRVRLEQERIGFDYFMTALKTLGAPWN